MKYVEWVEVVLRAAVESFDSGDGYWTRVDAIADRVGAKDESAMASLSDALGDLEALGLVQLNGHNVAIGQEARKIRYGSLRSSWATLTEVWLEPRQEEFLRTLSVKSERRHDEFAELDLVDGDDVLSEMAMSPDPGSSNPLINQLSDLGLVDANHRTFGRPVVAPTYRGLVRALEKTASETQQLVLQLLEDWETTNCEFKRELRLGTKDEKAEFIRDIVALANTQVTGDRYLITGFDPKTRSFAVPADPRIGQDTIEDLLNEYTKPPATMSYKTAEWIDGTGEIGVLRIIRNRANLPYRVSRDLGGISRQIHEGDVFVRHGSHVARPSDEELADLDAERRRAEQPESP